MQPKDFNKIVTVPAGAGRCSAHARQARAQGGAAISAAERRSIAAVLAFRDVAAVVGVDRRHHVAAALPGPDRDAVRAKPDGDIAIAPVALHVTVAIVPIVAVAADLHVDLRQKRQKSLLISLFFRE
jgi:hypothetical protein